jgi:uncharacterized protein (DUF849 family)
MSAAMLEGRFQSLSESELADAWVLAFKALASDYRSRDLLADVEVIGDEMRGRGLSPPMDRVAAEMSSIADRMRQVEVEKSPDAIKLAQAALENDLMSFVQERNDKGAA